MITPAFALWCSATVASVGMAIGSIEDLHTFDTFRQGGLLSWSFSRERERWTSSGWGGKCLEVIQGDAFLRSAMIASVVAALCIPFCRDRPRLLSALSLLIVGKLVITNIRSVYGLDGSDHVNFLVFAAVGIGQWVRPGSIAQLVYVWFLALEAVAAYTIAGKAKIISSQWRSGAAITHVMASPSYGSSSLFSYLNQRRFTAVGICWAVILFECGFALTLAGKPICLAVLAVGILFHAGCAVFMGLNNFLWAFLSLYPAVWFCARS